MTYDKKKMNIASQSFMYKDVFGVIAEVTEYRL